MRFITTGILLLLTVKVCSAQGDRPARRDLYRPLFHFTPKAHWMNDPNGLVLFDGTYHLFFQYYPDDIVWGPMHWGHATSPDLVHWSQQPIALYPDSLGYIFSGSAVVDSANTSGFGQEGKMPLVAIFTHHDPKGEKSGSNTYQNQSLAYSLDKGATWTKYAGNPVLKNPGITDFRDPSVSWHPAEKKWVMALATKDRISFYSSPDLKSWTKESEFGATLGGHGGVWECPNLFPLQGRWVLLVSNNPGGPNGGSGTQYFIGDWDGHRFAATDTATRWIDYGPDDYAGVTYNNTGGRRIFLGWMSNWEYANQVPTATWRNAMTIPRELSLLRADGATATQAGAGDPLFLASQPYPRFPALHFSRSADSSFTLRFANATGQQLLIGYDASANQYYIDRTHSGRVDFHPGFGSRYTAPRISTDKKIRLTLVMDAASVELFADDGLTVMTAVFFADQPLKLIK